MGLDRRTPLKLLGVCVHTLCNIIDWKKKNYFALRLEYENLFVDVTWCRDNLHLNQIEILSRQLGDVDTIKGEWVDGIKAPLFLKSSCL